MVHNCVIIFSLAVLCLCLVVYRLSSCLRCIHMTYTYAYIYILSELNTTGWLKCYINIVFPLLVLYQEILYIKSLLFLHSHVYIQTLVGQYTYMVIIRSHMLERFYQWICVCCTFNLEFVFTCIRLQLRAFFFLRGDRSVAQLLNRPLREQSIQDKLLVGSHLRL